MPKAKSTKRQLPNNMDKHEQQSAKRSKAGPSQRLPGINSRHKPVKTPTSEDFRRANMDGGSDPLKPRGCKQSCPDEFQEDVHPQNKRVKFSKADGSNDHPQTPSTNDPGLTGNAANAKSEKASEIKADPLPMDVRHLVQKYDFSTLSILSSSKIESRVSSLLGRFSFATPGAKPGVVILSAKAEVAGKMGSIVEIAKHRIEEERGKWWQYNKLSAELSEMESKQGVRPLGGKTLEESDMGQNASVTSQVTNAKEHTSTAPHVGEGIIVGDEDEDEGMEDVFEQMTNPNMRASDSTFLGKDDQKKVRKIPRLTIILATVRVIGLNDDYR